MNEIIIKNWEDVDVTTFYQQRVKDQPLVYNAEENFWIAHSYEFCKVLFLNSQAVIPKIQMPEAYFPVKQVSRLITSLARLSNDNDHMKSRMAAKLFYGQIKNVDISIVLASLLSDQNDLADFDFVSTVAMKLPVLQILKGLDFADDDINWMIANLPYLVKIMSPVKTVADMHQLDIVVPGFFEVVSAHKELKTLAEYLQELNPETDFEEATNLLVCNLIGLFIQCYDAGRGLLTNIILHWAQLDLPSTRLICDPLYSQKVVVEILRHNPSVHNTRRIAVKDLIIGGTSILKGQSVLIVMAAANLDNQKFEDPGRFDPERVNNNDHLTFGLGGHACIAKSLMIGLGADVLNHLVRNYNLLIPPQNITYEAQLNARLVKSLMVNLNKL